MDDINSLSLSELRALVHSYRIQPENQEKNLETKQPQKQENQECPICKDDVEVPVSWNGFSKTKKDSFGKHVYEPCSASEKNPHCLRCARATMRFHKEQNKKDKKTPSTFKCWAGCHTISTKNCRSYGTIGRDPNDLACPLIYATMDKYGVGKTDCRLCEKDCGSVTELAKHIRNECPERKIECKLCKCSIISKNMEKHREVCFKFCMVCGPQVKITCNNDGTTDHICPNRTLSTCQFCNHEITLNNIQSHQDCPRMNSRNLTTFNNQPRHVDSSQDVDSSQVQESFGSTYRNWPEEERMWQSRRATWEELDARNLDNINPALHETYRHARLNEQSHLHPIALHTWVLTEGIYNIR